MGVRTLHSIERKTKKMRMPEKKVLSFLEVDVSLLPNPSYPLGSKPFLNPKRKRAVTHNNLSSLHSK